jgi:NAD(P)-dependent dehydrogenase (short-subunit alcohol dehydrogenase family)
MSVFSGRTVLITGAGTGLGRALAEALGREGAVVYVSALHLAEAEPVAALITRAGGRAYAVKLDAREVSDLESVMGHIVASHGSLDYVFNNAGIVFVGAFAEMKPAQVHNLAATNFVGPALGMLTAIQYMRKQGAGHIVNVASIGGLMPVSSMAMYSGTKHGLVGLSDSVRAEVSGDGIRINTVCMGFVESDLLKRSDKGAGAEGGIGELLKSTPPISAALAAQLVLRGIRRNQPYILFPAYTKAGWWIRRLLPDLANWIAKKSFERFRRATAR